MSSVLKLFITCVVGATIGGLGIDIDLWSVRLGGMVIAILSFVGIFINYLNEVT